MNVRQIEDFAPRFPRGEGFSLIGRGIVAVIAVLTIFGCFALLLIEIIRVLVFVVLS